MLDLSSQQGPVSQFQRNFLPSLPFQDENEELSLSPHLIMFCLLAHYMYLYSSDQRK